MHQSMLIWELSIPVETILSPWLIHLYISCMDVFPGKESPKRRSVKQLLGRKSWLSLQKCFVKAFPLSFKFAYSMLAHLDFLSDLTINIYVTCFRTSANSMPTMIQKLWHWAQLLVVVTCQIFLLLTQKKPTHQVLLKFIGSKERNCEYPSLSCDSNIYSCYLVPSDNYRFERFKPHELTSRGRYCRIPGATEHIINMFYDLACNCL